jgi:hypothetical protein
MSLALWLSLLFLGSRARMQVNNNPAAQAILLVNIKSGMWFLIIIQAMTLGHWVS